ncbi:MAG: Gfo/Idh/MocA family oxidoreductase [Chloroflexi bacterium]|nr:Gfo/Idh/MocA family oxidoreductase [Chloroflexota bacterium]
MTDRLRVGVIGAGAMGEAHLRSYRAVGAQIVGVASRTAERARELAERYGAEAIFPDARSLIDATQPDGVSVTTGEHDHVEPTRYALEHGVGVLLEKPIASSLADARLIADLVHATGSILVPAHLLRFAPPYRALKARVAAGDIGDVIAVSTRRDRTVAIAHHYAHVHPAFLTAVHDIDLILWLTGSRFVRIRALQHRDSGRGQVDLAWAQGELASSAIASVSVAQVHPEGSLPYNSDRIEVYGSAGVAVVDLSLPLATVRGETTTAPDWLLEPPDGLGAFGAEIAHFCDCLRSRRPSDVVSVDEAVEGISVADAIVRSAEAGGSDVWL